MEAYLGRIEAKKVRKIDWFSIEPHPRVNVITGLNGSGKTSILESISILGTGKSFRTNRISDVIQKGFSELSVVGKVCTDNGAEKVIGLARGHRKGSLRVDGETIRKSSEILKYLPVLATGPYTNSVLTGGPKERRNLIDKTLFHVEQNYIAKWREYHQAIQQRNALLRNNANPSLFYAWHEILSVLGQELHQNRISCIDNFSRILTTLPINRFFGDVSITYKCGWRKEKPLLEELNMAIHTDKATGTTSVGPHRAEASICVDGMLAHKVLSRGQVKLAVSTLAIAQARVIFEHTSMRPLFLFDDFGSELDSPSQFLLWDMVSSTCGQIFLTSIDLDSLPISHLEKAHFHLLNGAVKRLH